MINWIMEVLEKFSNIGGSVNGVTRLAFTKEDTEARNFLLSLLNEIDIPYKIDCFGNIFATYKGELGGKVVATGSHIDTVPGAGKYDGVLGVVSSLAVIKRLKEENVVLARPIELIVFQAEESSRFGHSTLGSKVIIGSISDFNQLEQATDNNGITLPLAMKEAGNDFYNIKNCVQDKDKYKAFIELHIDQSKNLMHQEKPVGVVFGIAAPLRVKVTIFGEAAHSGSTAMRDRKDALVIASELILAIKNISLAYDERNAIATVGKLNIYPGALNVVPGSAEMYVDIRGIQSSTIDEIFGLIRSESSKIALRYSATSEIELLNSEKPVQLNNFVTDIIEKSCKELGIDYAHTISGAGHDAMNMAQITDTGMIFVRNVSGKSHNMLEEIHQDDIEKGFEVLYSTIKHLGEI